MRMIRMIINWLVAITSPIWIIGFTIYWVTRGLILDDGNTRNVYLGRVWFWKW